MNPDQQAKSSNIQLTTALNKVASLKKEKQQLYTRITQVEDPNYLDNLKAQIEKKELLLKKLQNSLKSRKQKQQHRDKTIQNEINRSEQALNTRLLQEIVLENEGLRGKIKDLEAWEERNAASQEDLEKQQQKLEGRYAKLMVIARENGTFEENSRGNRKIKRLKATYEEQKAALAAAEVSLEATLKQFKRMEGELKTEIEALRVANSTAVRQLREKQGEISNLLEELEKLRPKLHGSGYEALLERIKSSIKEREGLIDQPITPIRVQSPQETRARKSSSKGGKEIPRRKPQEDEEEKGEERKKTEGFSEKKNTKPNIFASPVSLKEEKPIEPSPKPIEQSPKPPETVQTVPKKPNLLSKPSLFSSPSTSKVPAEQPVQPVVVPKPEVDPLADLIPSKEVAVPVMPVIEEVKATPVVIPEPQESKPSGVKEEIGTLDTFPSRRRGKKPVLDTPSLLTSPVIEAKEPEKPPISDLQPRPRDRSHLLSDDPPVPLPPTNLVEEKSVSVLPKPRDRSHLVEDKPQATSSTLGSEGVEVRNRTPVMETGLMDRKKELKVGSVSQPVKSEKTAELAKKAEKGGFFSLEEQSDSFDFTDLNQAVKPVVASKPVPRVEEPVVKKVESKKQATLELEEEDLVL